MVSDVATDGTKLDGIEANATADQTQSEINALGITATGLSGTPNITVGTISSGVHTITSTGTIGNASGGAGGYLKIQDGTDTLAFDTNEIHGTERIFITSEDAEILFRGLSNAGVVLKNGTTQFMDASRNLSSIGTISSGMQTITYTGVTIPNDSATGLRVVDSRTAAADVGGSISLTGAYNSTTLLGGSPYIRAYKANGTQGDYSFGLKFGIRKNGSGSAAQALQLDEDKNATFAGTISSGAITSTGEIEATALDINGNGDISGNLTLGGYLAGPATFTIDPAAVGDNTGTVVVAGNLQVDGTTTTINSTTLTVDDKNITLASGSTNSGAANGAGLTVDCGSDTDTTFTYNGTSAQWETNTELVIQPRHTSGTPPSLTLGDLNNQFQSGISSSNHLTMRANGSGNLYWQNGNTYLMMLSSGGNLSIGNGSNAASEVLDVTGNIAVSGTVDGRDVATDGTKLDGIESGATADQTAAEILTAIKTVDGVWCSGLDADLLRWYLFSFFLEM
jgi:hypothetical protein